MNKRKRVLARRIVSTLVVLGILAAGFPAQDAHALQMGQIRWIQKRIKASIGVDSATIQFTVPTGVDAASETLVLTFDSGVTLASEVAANFDFEVGSTGTCSSASFVDEALALTAAAGTWGIDVTGQAITLTSPTDATTGEITAGRCVQLIAGNGTDTGGTGSTTTITNGTAGNYDVDITSELGAVDDSGSGSISIIADEQVAVTATVDPSITFTVDDNTIFFGTLTTANGRWAGASAGTNAPNGSTQPDAAHTMTVATNAQTGWAVTYNGATLTSGANDINVGSTDEDSDGAPGTTELFGITASTSGDATIAAGYLRDASADFNFVASTTTTLVSETVATATETITVSALANITGSTPAGAYSTTLTYIASGTF